MSEINYFEILGLSPQWDLCATSLQQAYFKKQQAHHPDLYVMKSDGEKQYALEQSALINEAYEILKSPLRRAGHLLALKGLDMTHQDQDVLMQMMEWQEEITEASFQDFPLLHTRLQKEIEAAQAGFGQAFYAKGSKELLKYYASLSYLVKMDSSLKQKMNHKVF